jgi:hypothetical protein
MFYATVTKLKMKTIDQDHYHKNIKLQMMVIIKLVSRKNMNIIFTLIYQFIFF